jgi:hypothetical protein
LDGRQLEVKHPNLILLHTDLRLSTALNTLLDIRLLIQNTKLIISIDELDTSVVPALTGHLILLLELKHVFLNAIDDFLKLSALRFLLGHIALSNTNSVLYLVDLRYYVISDVLHGANVASGIL